MFRHYLCLGLKTLRASGFYLAILIATLHVWYVSYSDDFTQDLMVKIILTLVVIYTLIDFTDNLYTKHKALVQEREDVPIEQIGKYHRFWYDDGKKLSKRYTSYVAAHKDWCKMHQ